MGLEIQSKEVIDKISDELKLQPAMKIPRELMDKIQLVYGINPEREIQVDSTIRATTGSGNILTTSATKKTFLVGATMGYMHDATADSTDNQFLIIPKGKAAQALLRLSKLTTTADARSISISFDKPIELEPGTVVSIQQAFTVGAGTISGTVIFYETEPQ